MSAGAAVEEGWESGLLRSRKTGGTAHSEPEEESDQEAGINKLSNVDEQFSF